jgi:hypothetical protein
LGIKQYAEQEGRFGVFIDPVMIGASLNHRIEGLEVYFSIIKKQRDLAPKEDYIVDRPRSVHHRMPAGIDLTMRCPYLCKLFRRSPPRLGWSESFGLGAYLKQAEDRAGS